LRELIATEKNDVVSMIEADRVEDGKFRY
jgi:hypothetical protein